MSYEYLSEMRQNIESLKQQVAQAIANNETQRADFLLIELQEKERQYNMALQMESNLIASRKETTDFIFDSMAGRRRRYSWETDY
jgi:hypothetical protein